MKTWNFTGKYGGGKWWFNEQKWWILYVYISIYLSFYLSFYVYISKTSFNNQKQCKIDPFGIKAAKMGGLIQELGLKFGPNLMMYDDISHHGDEDWHGDDIDERRSLAAASCSSTSFAATGAYVIHHVSSCIYYHCRVLTWGNQTGPLYILVGALNRLEKWWSSSIL